MFTQAPLQGILEELWKTNQSGQICISYAVPLYAAGQHRTLTSSSCIPLLTAKFTLVVS